MFHLLGKIEFETDTQSGVPPVTNLIEDAENASSNCERLNFSCFVF